MRYRVVSLFSGAGGLDLGFEMSGKYKIILANEMLETAAETYRQNFGLKKVKESFSLSDVPCIIEGDVAKIDFSPLEGEEIDVVIGGPPCQDFSIVRGPDSERKGVEVKRGQLYAHFIRALIKLQPRIFVFENVPGLKSSNRGMAYRTILEDFQNLELRWQEVRKDINGENENKKEIQGYQIIFKNTVNMSMLGVPQARQRLIIIGIRKDLIKLMEESFLWRVFKLQATLSGQQSLVSRYPLTPLETFEGKPLLELQDAYEDVMREYKNVWEDVKTAKAFEWKQKVWDNLTFDVLRDYVAANEIKEASEDQLERALKEHEKILRELEYAGKRVVDLSPEDGSNELPKQSGAVLERMRRIPPGENHEFVRGTKWQVEGKGISLIYRRLHPLKPAYTIVAYGGGGTWGYHYERNRGALTNRERARLQTFPDWFLFNGKYAEVRAQIGEAVPPLAGKKIAEGVFDILSETY